MKHRTRIAIVTAAMICLPVYTDELPPVEMLPEAPPPPPPVASGEILEPDITIRHGEQQTVSEYRLNGHLYMIKVTPHKGYSYYLVDADGDGELETKRYELDPGFQVPSWVIFSW